MFSFITLKTSVMSWKASPGVLCAIARVIVCGPPIVCGAQVSGQPRQSGPLRQGATQRRPPSAPNGLEAFQLPMASLYGRHTGTHTGMHSHTRRQTHRDTDIHTLTHGHIRRPTDMQTQTDIYTWTHRQTQTHTSRHTYAHTCALPRSNPSSRRQCGLIPHKAEAGLPSRGRLPAALCVLPPRTFNPSSRRSGSILCLVCTRHWIDIDRVHR